MTTLFQIADTANVGRDETEDVIRALIDTPWNCPSEINEQVAKSMVRKFVLGESE